MNNTGELQTNRLGARRNQLPFAQTQGLKKKQRFQTPKSQYSKLWFAGKAVKTKEYFYASKQVLCRLRVLQKFKCN